MPAEAAPRPLFAVWDLPGDLYRRFGEHPLCLHALQHPAQEHPRRT